MLGFPRPGALAGACVLFCSLSASGAARMHGVPGVTLGPVLPEPRPPDVALVLPTTGAATDKIDYAALPRLHGTHVVVNPPDQVLAFQLHSYLAYHDGLYWCMWSQGPPTEDEPSQQVRYATSADGLTWTAARPLTGAPEEGYAYIARGFWIRDGKLIALVAHFKGQGAFGVNKELELRSLLWSEPNASWFSGPTLFKDAINNFPPEKLRTGEWAMSRRDSRFNVHMLLGGQRTMDDWTSIPVMRRLQFPGFVPDEPIWWQMRDGSLSSLYRDNGGSSWLFRSWSGDGGHTWTVPLQTNFPNSPSKLFSLEVVDGCRVLISNANPAAGRTQLFLSASADGDLFTRMSLLDIPTRPGDTLQYPHALLQDGHLLIVFSRNKNSIELFRPALEDILPLCAATAAHEQPAR